MTRKKSHFKKVILYNTTNEQGARELASWISKQSKLIRCTVKKQIRKNGISYIVTLRYKISVRVSTFIQIGYNLCALTDGRVMKIESRKEKYFTPQSTDPITIAAQELHTQLEDLPADDLPF